MQVLQLFEPAHVLLLEMLDRLEPSAWFSISTSKLDHQPACRGALNKAPLRSCAGTRAAHASP